MRKPQSGGRAGSTVPPPGHPGRARGPGEPRPGLGSDLPRRGWSPVGPSPSSPRQPPWWANDLVRRLANMTWPGRPGAEPLGCSASAGRAVAWQPAGSDLKGPARCCQARVLRCLAVGYNPLSSTRSMPRWGGALAGLRLHESRARRARGVREGSSEKLRGGAPPMVGLLQRVWVTHKATWTLRLSGGGRVGTR